MTLLPFDLQKALAGHPVVYLGSNIDVKMAIAIEQIAYFKNVEPENRVIVTFNAWVYLQYFNEEGKSSEGALFLLALEPKKMKKWVNIYSYGSSRTSAIWDSKEQADRCSSSNRIACIPIEFTEGEGLEEGLEEGK